MTDDRADWNTGSGHHLVLRDKIDGVADKANVTMGDLGPLGLAALYLDVERLTRGHRATSGSPVDARPLAAAYKRDVLLKMREGTYDPDPNPNDKPKVDTNIPAYNPAALLYFYPEVFKGSGKAAQVEVELGFWAVHDVSNAFQDPTTAPVLGFLVGEVPKELQHQGRFDPDLHAADQVAGAKHPLAFVDAKWKVHDFVVNLLAPADLVEVRQPEKPGFDLRRFLVAVDLMHSSTSGKSPADLKVAWGVPCELIRERQIKKTPAVGTVKVQSATARETQTQAGTRVAPEFPSLPGPDGAGRSGPEVGETVPTIVTVYLPEDLIPGGTGKPAPPPPPEIPVANRPWSGEGLWAQLHTLRLGSDSWVGEKSVCFDIPSLLLALMGSDLVTAIKDSAADSGGALEFEEQARDEGVRLVVTGPAQAVEGYLSRSYRELLVAPVTWRRDINFPAGSYKEFYVAAEAALAPWMSEPWIDQRVHLDWDKATAAHRAIRGEDDPSKRVALAQERTTVSIELTGDFHVVAQIAERLTSMPVVDLTVAPAAATESPATVAATPPQQSRTLSS